MTEIETAAQHNFLTKVEKWKQSKSKERRKRDQGGQAILREKYGFERHFL